MKSVYLGPVAGVLHDPQGPPSGLGVLFVPPLGWDDQSTFRPRRAWAAALAEDGHTVLRIDLPGTGDSGGSPQDEGLVDAWRVAIADAVAWLGAERTAIVALGLGGLLSLGAGADSLVLWGAPARGRSLLRELKAFGRLEAAQTGEAPGAGAGLTAGGHTLSEATVAAVGALEAGALLADGAPTRALLLGRDGVEPDAKLADALRAAGTEVETDPGEGWGAATAGPQLAEVPTVTIERTRAWLRTGAGSAAPSPAAAADHLPVPGARETALRIGPCFGVLTEPDGGADLTAVMLNAGAIRHIGPNRMWVEAGRRWAARGIATLRVDLEGIGEADGTHDPYVDDVAFYAPDLTDQVGRILDVLAERGLPPRFMLAGLCSGGYWALHIADRDPRVKAVVLLNPQLLFWDAEAGPRREVRRALSVLTPKGFRALLRADRPFARLLAVIRYLLARPFRPGGDAVPAQSAVRELVDRLVARGQHVAFAFSGSEPLHDELRRSGDAEALTIHALPLRSHTLKPLEAQRAAHAVLDGAVERARG